MPKLKPVNRAFPPKPAALTAIYVREKRAWDRALKRVYTPLSRFGFYAARGDLYNALIQLRDARHLAAGLDYGTLHKVLERAWSELLDTQDAASLQHTAEGFNRLLISQKHKHYLLPVQVTLNPKSIIPAGAVAAWKALKFESAEKIPRPLLKPIQVRTPDGTDIAVRWLTPDERAVIKKIQYALNRAYELRCDGVKYSNRLHKAESYLRELEYPAHARQCIHSLRDYLNQRNYPMASMALMEAIRVLKEYASVRVEHAPNTRGKNT